MQITPPGARSSTTRGTIALAANDLGDAGLSSDESTELNRLLLKIALATNS